MLNTNIISKGNISTSGGQKAGRARERVGQERVCLEAAERRHLLRQPHHFGRRAGGAAFVGRRRPLLLYRVPGRRSSLRRVAELDDGAVGQHVGKQKHGAAVDMDGRCSAEHLHVLLDGRREPLLVRPEVGALAGAAMGLFCRVGPSMCHAAPVECRQDDAFGKGRQ